MKSRVKEVLNEKGITVRELMKLTGLSSATIHRAKTDSLFTACTLETFISIARACGCQVKDLFTEDN